MDRRVLTVIATGWAFLAGATCAQTIYTWKDAAGSTHYSQNPPPGKARVLTLHQDKLSPPPATAASSNKAPSVEATLDKAGKDFRRQDCATARANLKLLSGSGMVLSAGTVSKPAGVLGARKLSDAQRSAAKVQAQAHIHSYCDRG